jgi:DNA polymerase III epsilon subunit-like protein
MIQPMILQTPVSALKYVSIDLETTGHSKRDKVCEVGAAFFTLDGLEAKIWNQLCNPGIHIPSDATACHHITNEMVIGQPMFEEAIRAIAEHVEGRVGVFHNAGYDLRWLSTELNLPYVVDTLQLSRLVMPELKSHSLRALKPEPRPWHRAGPDAEATAYLFSDCVELLAEKMGREPQLQDVIRGGGN